MRNMVAPLLYNEITKASRTKLPYFGIIAAAIICVLTFVVTKAIASQETLNGWGYASLSMQWVFSDIGLIFVAVFSAMLIAEETSSGTARTVLSAPVSRWEFYLAKVLTGLIYAMLVSIASLIMSVFLGSLHYQFGDIADSAGLVYAKREVLANFLIAFFLSWLPLASTVLYGIFISTIVRKTGQAVAVAIGTIYLIDFTKHFIGIDSYVFTRYLGFSWGIFHQVAQGVDYQWLPGTWRMVAVSLVYCFVAFTLGLAIFARRDFNG